MVLKDEVAKMKSELNVSVPPKVVSNLSYKVIFQDCTLMKHFLGAVQSLAQLFGQHLPN